MVFPVVMYGCESWTVKKAERQRINAFELWCWRRLLRVPRTARRSNLSIIREISLEYSLEGLMLKLNSNTLATWCKEPTQWKRPWCWERLRVGEERGYRGRDGWMASWTPWTWVWAKLWELVMDRETWHAAVHGIVKGCTRQSSWTTTTILKQWYSFFFSFYFHSKIYEHVSPWALHQQPLKDKCMLNESGWEEGGEGWASCSKVKKWSFYRPCFR